MMGATRDSSESQGLSESDQMDKINTLETNILHPFRKRPSHLQPTFCKPFMINCNGNHAIEEGIHNQIIIPDDAPEEEKDVHDILDDLDLNNINVKEYLVNYNDILCHSPEVKMLFANRQSSFHKKVKPLISIVQKQASCSALSLMERRKLKNQSNIS